MFARRPFRRTESDEWISLGLESQEAVIQAFDSVKEDDGTNKFSTNFVYSHIIRDHFVGQILWLGPANLQSTQTWERNHQLIKEYADRANKVDFYASIMNMV
jgi:hypothetical protein